MAASFPGTPTIILVGGSLRNRVTLSSMVDRTSARPALRKIGARIRELRKERGLSQETLAFDAGLAVNSIATIERGEANPSIAMLLAISRVLSVKVRELVVDV